MTNDPVNLTSAGIPSGSLGGNGGLGNNRVNAVVLATVLNSQEAAMKQLLTSLGIGSQINALF